MGYIHSLFARWRFLSISLLIVLFSFFYYAGVAVANHEEGHGLHVVPTSVTVTEDGIVEVIVENQGSREMTSEEQQFSVLGEWISEDEPPLENMFSFETAEKERLSGGERWKVRMNQWQNLTLPVEGAESFRVIVGANLAFDQWDREATIRHFSVAEEVTFPAQPAQRNNWLQVLQQYAEGDAPQQTPQEIRNDVVSAIEDARPEQPDFIVLSMDIDAEADVFSIEVEDRNATYDGDVQPEIELFWNVRRGTISGTELEPFHTSRLIRSDEDRFVWVTGEVFAEMPDDVTGVVARVNTSQEVEETNYDNNEYVLSVAPDLSLFQAFLFSDSQRIVIEEQGVPNGREVARVPVDLVWDEMGEPVLVSALAEVNSVDQDGTAIWVSQFNETIPEEVEQVHIYIDREDHIFETNEQNNIIIHPVSHVDGEAMVRQDAMVYTAQAGLDQEPVSRWSPDHFFSKVSRWWDRVKVHLSFSPEKKTEKLMDIQADLLATMDAYQDQKESLKDEYLKNAAWIKNVVQEIPEKAQRQNIAMEATKQHIVYYIFFDEDDGQENLVIDTLETFETPEKQKAVLEEIFGDNGSPWKHVHDSVMLAELQNKATSKELQEAITEVQEAKRGRVHASFDAQGEQELSSLGDYIDAVGDSPYFGYELIDMQQRTENSKKKALLTHIVTDWAKEADTASPKWKQYYAQLQKKETLDQKDAAVLLEVTNKKEHYPAVLIQTLDSVVTKETKPQKQNDEERGEASLEKEVENSNVIEENIEPHNEKDVTPEKPQEELPEKQEEKREVGETNNEKKEEVTSDDSQEKPVNTEKDDPNVVEDNVVIPQEEVCPVTSEPVCGSDGTTYKNSCIAEKNGVQIESKGACIKVEKPVRKVIQITPSGFSPETLTVSPGEVVIVQNIDSTAHILAGDTKTPQIPSGGSLLIGAPSNSGTYHFHSSVKGSFEGQLIVK